MNYLNELQVDQILSRQPDLIRNAILEALTEHREGRVRQTKHSLRKRENSPASDRLTSMMGFIGDPPRVVGFKLIGSASGNPPIGKPRASVLIVLCDPNTHAISHIINGARISLQRTAEIAMLGIQLLHPDVKKIAIVGTGELGEAVVNCVPNRIPEVEEISIFGRAQIEKLGSSGAISSDTVITATSANSPILTNSHLKDVHLVINLGLREISAKTIAGFDEHIVDDLMSCAKQTTPFAEALRSKSILHGRVHQLSTISKPPLPTRLKGRIYFQPSGIVAIDLLAAANVMESQK